MPRIRILKNYETSREDIVSPEGNEPDDEGMLSEISEARSISEFEEPEKGWWASHKIIASLSESKIKTAILYHKEQLRLLEDELLLRKLHVRTHLHSDLSHKPSSRFEIYSEKPILTPTDKKFKSVLRKGKLTKEQQELVFQVYLNSKQGA